MLKDGTDPMCRICGQFQETIDHIVAGFPWAGPNWMLTQTQQSRHISALEHLQRDEYKHKREMIRTSAPNSNTKRQYHNLVRYANKDGSRDKGQQTRHCNQEQTGLKLPAY